LRCRHRFGFFEDFSRGVADGFRNWEIAKVEILGVGFLLKVVSSRIGKMGWSFRSFCFIF
jgi:hypothetical protein